MAGVAESAVLVSSAAAAEAVTKLTRVEGPASDFHNAEHVLSYFPAMGFQASNFGRACHIAQRMLRRQAPSKVYQIKDGKYVLVRDDADAAEEDEGEKEEKKVSDRLVNPTLFLGVTANLFGTGCREAIRFLVQEGIVPNLAAQQGAKSAEDPTPPENATEDQLMFARLRREYRAAHGQRAFSDEPAPAFHSFLAALVVSGGGVEHDVRRACADYTVSHYASEGKWRVADGVGHFGNISYPLQGSKASALFDDVMTRFVRRLRARQTKMREAAAAQPIPERYLDVCSWSVAPSEVWALLGMWLVDLLTEALQAQRETDGAAESNAEESEETRTAAIRVEALRRARTTVVYWAAVQQVPLYSPSFVDGDIAAYLLPPPLFSAAAGAGEEGELLPLLQLDLVRDIHSINKLAMQSKKTGMLICGGGVVKHHICNANLMRNGADYTIILNNGQEFDGSDAGAKPEEALSWGKVRMEGEYVKVYGEITTYLPLLVAQVFVPAVRRRRDGQRQQQQQQSGASGTRRREGKRQESGEAAEEASRPRQRRRRLRREQRRDLTAVVSAEAIPEVVEGGAEEEKVTP